MTLTESTRQLRSRGNKLKTTNVSREKQGNVLKRKVLGEISNKRIAQSSDNKNANENRKPASKRKIAVVLQNVRRSTRTTNASRDNKNQNNLEHEAKRRKCDEKEPTNTSMTSNKLKTRSSTRATKNSQRKNEEKENNNIVMVGRRTNNRSNASDDKAENKVEDFAEIKIKKRVLIMNEKKESETFMKKSLEQGLFEGRSKKVKNTKNTKNNMNEVISQRGRLKSQTSCRKIKRRSKSEPRSLCSDFIVDSNFTLVRKSFDPSKYTAGIATYDKLHVNDALQVSNYVTDIYQRLYHTELQFQPDGFYMKEQDEINAMMRAILIDWLVEVHMKFKLVPDTLYLCVNIIDRYCSVVEVPRRKLQLVGVTALLLACKYEEIYPPEVRDCVYITDKAYSRQDVIDMEQDIVKKLEFKLTAPTGYKFLVRYLFVLKVSDITKAAANYYMEYTLQEYRFISFRPSLVAAAAVCLAINNPQICNAERGLGNKPGIPDLLIEYTGYERKEIFRVCEQIASNIGQQVVTASERRLIAVKRKFDSRKFHYVSTDLIDPDINDLLY